MTGRVLILGLLLACGHSEPFATAEQRNDGPFSPAVPVQLTYWPLGDHDPAFSADGNWVTYIFERHGADRDRCLALLPADGGIRRHEMCAWYVGEADSADGLGAAALRADGAIAFTLHTGFIGNLTSRTMGLYVGPADSIAGARLVLPLGGRPTGATESWSELVDPLWLDDDELMFLAARRHLVNASSCGTPPGPIARDCGRTPRLDTIPVGVELARLRLTPAGATVAQVYPAKDAIGWSLDRGAAMIHYIVQRPRPDLESVFHESLADTVFALPLAGGAPVPVYGTLGGDGAPLERLHGIASGGGRVFISRSWRGPGIGAVQSIVPGTELFSDISEILPDGSLRTIAPAISWRWGGIRLSPDGRHLVAEAVERTTSDVYLLELPQ